MVPTLSVGGVNLGTGFSLKRKCMLVESKSEPADLPTVTLAGCLVLISSVIR